MNQTRGERPLSESKQKHLEVFSSRCRRLARNLWAALEIAKCECNKFCHLEHSLDSLSSSQGSELQREWSRRGCKLMKSTTSNLTSDKFLNWYRVAQSAQQTGFYSWSFACISQFELSFGETQSDRCLQFRNASLAHVKQNLSGRRLFWISAVVSRCVDAGRKITQFHHTLAMVVRAGFTTTRRLKLPKKNLCE